MPQANPSHTAKALYDYTRQTDEEVNFTEDAILEVFDTSDPDWTLVGINEEYGFAPANYIELLEESTPKSPSVASTRRVPATPATPTAPEPEFSPSPPGSPVASFQGPAASLARVLGGGVPVSPAAARSISNSTTLRQQTTPEASDGEGEEPAPALPRRPPSSSAISPTQYGPTRDGESAGILPSPPYNRVVPRDSKDDAPVKSPGGFHLYNISEMVSAMGRRRKMPTTLGLNLATGIIMLSPEKSRDGPSQEWTADKMTHYSIEGKHVFLELVRPSKSLDLHAGARDTAEEIVSALGEIAGAVRGEGIREVIAAASGAGQKKGKALYDFMAQADDEITVAVGDEVIVLDDTRSEEWWMVRRLKNGKEGSVPSSYIDITGAAAVEPPSRSGVNAGRSTVEQNRLEEERLAKEAAKSTRNRSNSGSEAIKIRGVEVAPGMRLPERGSSLTADDEKRHPSHRERRSSKAEGKASRPSKATPFLVKRLSR